MTNLQTFGSMLLLAFGVFILFAGMFTAYFGAGKSRKVGSALMLVGLLALAFFVSVTWRVVPGVDMHAWDPEVVATGVAAVAGATLGVLVALGAFLVSIMRA